MRSECGQSMVEVAMCLPILCILLVATAQYGLMIWHHMELTSATRDGARRAAVARNEDDPSAVVRAVVNSSLDNVDPDDVNVQIAGQWTTDSVITVTTTMPYELDIVGFRTWSGNLTSEQRVRIG